MAISKQPVSTHQSIRKLQNMKVVTYFCMALVHMFMHIFLLVQGVYKHMHMHACTLKYIQVFEGRL